MNSSWLSRLINRRILYALTIGGLAGIGFMLFLIEFDELTSTEAFYTTCHSMELAAIPYRESTHYLPVSACEPVVETVMSLREYLPQPGITFWGVRTFWPKCSAPITSTR